MGKQDDDAVSGEIVQHQPQQKTVLNYDQIEKLARAFVASGMFGRDMDKISKGITKIMAGQELGLAPFASMRAVHVIEGNATLSSNTMAAMVKASPKYDYEIVEKDNMGCKIKFIEIRDGDRHALGVQSFTIEDAQTANLTNKANWRNHPEAMLFARCVSNGVRTYCPDVFSGMAVYTPEELEPVEATAERVQATDGTKQLDAGDNVDQSTSDEHDGVDPEPPMDGAPIVDESGDIEGFDDPELGDVELEDDPVPDDGDDPAASIYADASVDDLKAHVKDQLNVYIPKKQDQMRWLKDLTGSPMEPKKKADLVRAAEELDKLAEQDPKVSSQGTLIPEDNAKDNDADDQEAAVKK